LNNKIITISCLFGVAALLIGWDLYVYFAGSNVDMITNVIWETSGKHPILPFSLGVLMGHLFWGRGPSK